MSVCIRCGSHKQAPTGRCRCGFKPLPGSLDEAKSHVLSTQFRSPESLEAIAQAIRDGRPISFSDQELRLGRGIGRWNAAVTLSFLGSAVCLGIFIGVLVAGSPSWALVGAGFTAAAGFSGAFALMRRVDLMVRSVRAGGSEDSNEVGAGERAR